MKVYQVQETGGEWEDCYDFERGTYISKELAEKRMAELVKEELKMREQRELCYNCSDNISERSKMHCYKKYSDILPLGCVNSVVLKDDAEFKIEEIDVLGVK